MNAGDEVGSYANGYKDRPTSKGLFKGYLVGGLGDKERKTERG